MKLDVLKALFGEGSTVYYLFVWMIFIAAAIGGVTVVIKTVIKIAEFYRKKKNFVEEKVMQIDLNTTTIATLQESQAQIVTSLSMMTDKITGVSDQLQKMQDENDLQRRNSLKDRIRQLYAHYHETKEWNIIEKEALEGLITAYESAGGTNSYVHSVVEPEMASWKIVP